MNNAIYTMLGRQSGLMREMGVVANNIANMGTTGFKGKSGVFAEHVARLQNGAMVNPNGPDPSLSMGQLAAHTTDFSDGGLSPTGSPLDLALTGEGFFEVDTAQGARLTRAGHFMVSEQGQLVDGANNPVMSDAGGPIAIPPDAAEILVGPDGTITADGEQVGRVGVVSAPPLSLSREGTNYWVSNQTAPVENPQIASGFLEQSNVNPVLEMARMIEVQRHYDAGQSLVDLEDERIKNVARTVRQMT